MAQGSGIEWTESTWNPVTGCSKISPGCKYCYAERMAERLKAMGQPNYVNGFEITLQPQALALPLQWKKPQKIFVNSMSDLFHEEIPFDYLKNVFQVMNQADWHLFQVLTKRADRLEATNKLLNWTSNIWMGVSVENRDHQCRINKLRRTQAHIKFLSLEPLLGPLPNLVLEGIDWVIVGGESGPGARPMKKEWVMQIRDQCLLHSIPFFFKQWGGFNKKRTGRHLEGRLWSEYPDVQKLSPLRRIQKTAS
jgi:protein gp37